MASGGPRSGAGRKRKSPALSMTAAERAAVALPGTVAKMIPPLHLSDLEQLYFAQIAEQLEQQNRAEPQFAHVVALLAQRFEQIQRFQAVLEISGDVCTSTTVRKVDGKEVVTEMIRARPQVAMLSDAMRHAHSLLGELMLSPSAAMKIAPGKPNAPGDFDDF